MTPDVTFDQLLLDATELYVAGNIVGARTRIDKALARHPGEPRALSLLANILVAQRDHASATAIFKQLLMQFPGEPALHFKLGCEYFAQGDIHLGYAEVEQAVLSDPSNQEAVSFYQQVRRMLGLPMIGNVVDLSPELNELLSSVRSVLATHPATQTPVLNEEPEPEHVDEGMMIDEDMTPMPGSELTPSPVSRVTQRDSRATDRLCVLDIHPGPHLVFTPECVKIPVNGSWFVREKLVLCWHMGLSIVPAQERFRGQAGDRKITSEVTGDLVECQGRGVVSLVPTEKCMFMGFNLEDSPLYIMEERVVAFAGELKWENGWLRGESHKVPLISFRGRGSVIIQLPGRLYSVPLPEEEYLIASIDRLVGWDGYVVAQYSHSSFIQVAGSGSLLLQS
ncbi:AIM24 family protein [Myxococcota bacterium]|jgi:hypothetical protein|nr:AIM24 family protein [Myxococcota bacterium]MBU1413520.1 AIM24 family protein [Myxococcota bacterium]MBU1511259.1 AIM24 family protein [Myxococcota bacterium]PKN17879.1 MAG: hypothetical protein CVU65_18240 [Deltaproteobacteria bacterium HGW-Deltaproteobacteria-22]